ncbi:MAG TPA: DUF790 family protein [Ktedonobacterales bacterium]|nr:DUF790 family protein [Ktedonobacterales bacterium]
MLKLTDLRKTTRKSGDRRVVYPHFLRDRALAPRIELAIRYLESMVGHPRRELEQEVVLKLFGDHKIARCVVACLGATYRHRPRTFAEELAPAEIAALAARGINGPSDLRLWLFRRANVAPGPGFVGGVERAPFLRSAGDDLGLSIEQIERLITLDHPTNALLVRLGPIPTADDVIARFNAATVAALLANAKSVRLSLSKLPTVARRKRASGVSSVQRTPTDVICALCELAGVMADVTGDALTLHGRQDALESWARHGGRLARLLTMLLAAGLPARSGEAIIVAPTGDEWVFRLPADILAMIGGSAELDATASAATLLASWERADAFAADMATLRRAGDMDGWSVRRATEPLVTAEGATTLLYTCLRGDERAYLAPPPATQASAQRLVALAARVPLLILDLTAPRALGDTPTANADGIWEAATGEAAAIPTLRYCGRGDRAALAELPTLLARVTTGVAHRVDVSQLTAVFAEARESGALTEARLAERLGCAEDDIPMRLANPQTQNERVAQGLQYVEGFGLCTVETLERAQTAAQDVASKWQAEAQGGALMTRMLSRRLREITGASEGIECLIAYLNAA